MHNLQKVMVHLALSASFKYSSADKFVCTNNRKSNIMQDVYINAIGVFLPGEPVSNDEIEQYLGEVNGKPSLLKDKILRQNGIKTRYYAINKEQKSVYSNAELAAKAVQNALNKSTLKTSEVQFLATATTQADLPVPGFASMVHGLIDIPNCEIASFQSVCASGMMALKDAFAQIRSGEKQNAVCVSSEFASRLFKGSRFESQGVKSLPFDTEFLRWMLSDGAGAFVLENTKNKKGFSLKINWIDIRSQANNFPLCMYAGKTDNKDENTVSWLDYPDFSLAANDGAINLKQDVRLLDKVVKTGIAHFFDLINNKKVEPNKVDWLCCHYSSEYFVVPIKDLMEKGGVKIPEEKWFSNLSSKGNTGSASIFIILEELFYSGKLKKGETILCMVPESGRFTTSFMSLIVEGGSENVKSYKITEPQAPNIEVNNGANGEWLVRELSKIWIDFEAQLIKTPIISKMYNGLITIEDYKLLLKDLRQQVIDGSQWIARAASNISIDLFELRSAFIKHTAAEHKDYQLLEKNFINLGEDINVIRAGEKNIGSLALTSFIFQQASKPNPIDLLGAMFIIEGIGKRLAAPWGIMMKEQLNLTDEQVSFFTYHGVADEQHFHNLEQALNHPSLNMDVAKSIAKTAKTTARLWRLQLEELGNY